MKTDKKTDRICYIAGWCILAVIALIAIFLKTADISLTEWIRPCLFHRVTGFYCPGCGGTRAVAAFFRGDWLSSFLYHPIVCYTAAVGGCFMISQTVEKLSNGKLPVGMHYRNCYLWTALVITLLHFAVSNISLL